jgi:hypothetical protein
MNLPLRILVLLALVALSSGLLAFQRGGYIEMDGESFPPDGTEKVEWIFSRFHYSASNQFDYFGVFHRWAADYPKSDRQFLMGVRRLTRIDTRPTGQVLDADSRELLNYPWLYVEDAGRWLLSEQGAARLREYLLRGGFLFADDTHGDEEWQIFLNGLQMIFPDRPIEDLKNDDEIFHIMYDLDDRVQIPGTRYIWGNRSYTPDSAVPRWRAIRDDKGRIMVAICHNSDVGDAWEWADSPHYPERAAGLAYRIGINYIIYGMTH